MALKLIVAPHALTIINGAGHDLRRGKFDLSALTIVLSELLAKSGSLVLPAARIRAYPAACQADR